HFHNNGENHGRPLGLFIEVVGQVTLDGLLDGGPVGGVPGVHVQDGVQRHLAQLVHQALGLLHIHKAPGDDVRAGAQAPVLAGHADYDYHHAVLGQMAAVPPHHAAYVAHAGAVHKHLARGDGATQLAGLGGELDHPADVADDDVVGSHAHLPGQLGVDLQVALLPVDGNEELGLDQAVDDLQLLLAGVAGHVEGHGPLVHHVGSLPVELVDHVAHGVLVAGNGGGGDDDLVPGLDVHLPVV